LVSNGGEEENADVRNRYLGCLFGLAIGDALGAPVEFLSISEIRSRYGEAGVTDFHGWGGFRPGSFTDDTQMSLATAVGCIRAYQRGKDRGICHPAGVVYRRYLEWLRSQSDPFQRRAPGNTCLAALRSGKQGSIEERINDSKGCGGVMRTAPAGLAFPPGRAFREGAECAALTHGHPSGYLSAGFLSELIAHLVGGTTLEIAVDNSLEKLVEYEDHTETLEKIQEARSLAAGNEAVDLSIRELGGGWVGEEALAIALYCSLKFPDDWRKGTVAAANHSGDSDSTASIAGSILGTSLGIESIPQDLVRDVEDAQKIRKIADDMYRIFQNGEELSLEEYPPT
jgi:ADP-ribosylglycohydrolase